MTDKIHIYSIIFLLGISSLIGCQRVPQKQGSRQISNIQEKIDSIGNKFIGQGKVVGMSIAIVKDRDTLYNNSFGFADSLRSVTTKNEDIFLMASISKLVGATLVMKLVEEGVFSLEDKLVDLLPDFPNKDQAERIKLRHLISMTSGLKEYAHTIDSVYMTTGKSPEKEDYYDFFNNHELDFEPGSFYRYSNSGFLIMSMIVEKTTKIPYKDHIERIVNRPTGLDIKLISERLKDSEMSDYFELMDSTIIHRPHWPWIKGDGGMTISAIELAHYPIYWMNGTVISNNSFQQMITPTLLTEGFTSEYGLGVKNGSFEGEKMFGHSGGDKSTFSMMFYFPDKGITIVVLVNTNNTPASARNIFAEVARTVLGKEKPDYKAKEVKSNNLFHYTGSYVSPGDKITKAAYIVLNTEDQHLYYSFDQNANNGEKMYHLGNNEFWIERWPYDRIIFVRDSADRIIAFKEFYGGYMSQLKRKAE